jgi:2-isopropylmalate synthase
VVASQVVLAPDVAALIHDWNLPEGAGPASSAVPSVALLDDTLRDGLQNAAVRQPSLDEKRELLHLMAGAGVTSVNLGLPGSSRAAFESAKQLCLEIARERLPLAVVCAGRTLETDMRAIVELAERTGLPIEGHAFVGTSAIRAAAEGWEAALIAERTRSALGILVGAGLSAAFVSEDTTRSRPDALCEIFSVALDAGATRICLCDTVGHATPLGARRLVSFTQDFLAGRGARVALDWHGHNDRGLGLANALSAIDAGVSRVHATLLGVGERVGNVQLELVILNLALAGHLPLELEPLSRYASRMAELLAWTIPPNHPLLGENAFRTATGVHAAAIVKARRLGDALSDQVYSAVPARAVGRKQEIRIGRMSGRANVVSWLAEHGIEVSDAVVRAVLERARAADHLLSDEEIMETVRHG